MNQQTPRELINLIVDRMEVAVQAKAGWGRNDLIKKLSQVRVDLCHALGETEVVEVSVQEQPSKDADLILIRDLENMVQNLTTKNTQLEARVKMSIPRATNLKVGPTKLRELTSDPNMPAGWDHEQRKWHEFLFSAMDKVITGRMANGSTLSACFNNGFCLGTYECYRDKGYWTQKQIPYLYKLCIPLGLNIGLLQAEHNKLEAIAKQDNTPLISMPSIKPDSITHKDFDDFDDDIPF